MALLQVRYLNNLPQPLWWASGVTHHFNHSTIWCKINQVPFLARFTSYKGQIDSNMAGRFVVAPLAAFFYGRL